MASTQHKSLSSDRVRGPPSANVDLLECLICQDILWKPVACQSCETAFCSTCINRWLANNPAKCPNRCESYIERKCPPLIVKLLAQLQLSCSYQEQGCKEIIPYEALEKHELECGYRSQQCPGCKLQILMMDYVKHESDCDSIEITCPDCNIVYKRGDASTQHTETVCLKEQLRVLHEESKDNKLQMQELMRQLRELRSVNPGQKKVSFNFADLPSAEKQSLAVPNRYKGLKWAKMGYMHRLLGTTKYPESGYASAFTPVGSPHIAFFKDEASFAIERPNESFTLFSLHSCAVWKDDLQLTIKGYLKSVEINAHTVTLGFGKPQLIFLQWKNIDRVTFESSGGTLHPGSSDTAGCQVILTQLTIGEFN